jgi:hypothetical protein
MSVAVYDGLRADSVIAKPKALNWQTLERQIWRMVSKGSTQRSSQVAAVSRVRYRMFAEVKPKFR